MRRFLNKEVDMPKIIYKDSECAVIIKPVGMPSQPDPSGDPDAMSVTSELLEAAGEGRELWLVHRLDRAVGGLMVFARTKRAAARLSEAAADGTLGKSYYAVTEGRAEGGEMRDLLFKDSKTSKAYVVDRERKGAKLAVLEYAVLDVKETDKGARTLVKVHLKTGRFHQIRAQFASRGLSLVGDGKYGGRDKGTRVPALFSCELSTVLISRGKTVSARPDTSIYPWSLFDEEKYV